MVVEGRVDRRSHLSLLWSGFLLGWARRWRRIVAGFGSRSSTIFQDFEGFGPRSSKIVHDLISLFFNFFLWDLIEIQWGWQWWWGGWQWLGFGVCLGVTVVMVDGLGVTMVVVCFWFRDFEGFWFRDFWGFWFGDFDLVGRNLEILEKKIKLFCGLMKMICLMIMWC